MNYRSPPPPRPEKLEPDSELAKRTYRRVTNMQTTPGDILVPLALALIFVSIVFGVSLGLDMIFGTAQERWMIKCEKVVSRAQCFELYKGLK